jgi:hypothetical protein
MVMSPLPSFLLNCVMLMSLFLNSRWYEATIDGKNQSFPLLSGKHESFVYRDILFIFVIVILVLTG